MVLFLPWLSAAHQYDGVFEAQFRLVSKPWWISTHILAYDYIVKACRFAFFQVMGAYTGGGLSLVDLWVTTGSTGSMILICLCRGMVPFANAYLMIGRLPCRCSFKITTLIQSKWHWLLWYWLETMLWWGVIYFRFRHRLMSASAYIVRCSLNLLVQWSLACALCIACVWSCMGAFRLFCDMQSSPLRSDSWLASKFLPENSEHQQALSFLLDHPRRYYPFSFETPIILK